MAVKYQEIKNKLEKTPLNKEELEIIAKVEAHIDELIKNKFDCTPIQIDFEVLEFKFNPDTPKEHSWNVWKDIKTTRKNLMTDELKKRYEDAGWTWKFYQGEDDGPNRPSFDYWILKGKK